ncbi:MULTISPECIES: NAD-dependent deacetylase [unclassified Thiocapsa]|uniref:NAD-dependent deacetylase n=1 Tax=unclassified Thiocapsa TaxID=2641286 RepID=UPI0035B1D8C7
MPTSSHETEPYPPELLTRLRACRHLLVLTGAGVSQESGIPTFRDALNGLWGRFDPARLATPEAFDADPALVWGWYAWRRAQVLLCKPNPAHRAIAALADRVPRLTLVTQNVDGLHQRAGSPDVLELHGSLHRPYCRDCGHPHALSECTPDLASEGFPLPPPRCECCGGPVRPGVVWFGEALPGDVWDTAETAAKDCDLVLVVGTSALVYPAAVLPLTALEHGAGLVQINPDVTDLDDLATFRIRGTAARFLPELVRQGWPDAD